MPALNPAYEGLQQQQGAADPQNLAPTWGCTAATHQNQVQKTTLDLLGSPKEGSCTGSQHKTIAATWLSP